jgi:hypothetical protein
MESVLNTSPPLRLSAEQSFNSVQREAPAFGSVGLGGVDLICDASGAFRNTASAVLFFRAEKDPVCFSAIGITTCFSIFSGVLKLNKGLKGSFIAQKIGDVWGQRLAYLQEIGGVCCLGGGLTFIPIRAFPILSALTDFKAGETVSLVLGRIGTGLFGAVSALTIVSTGIEIYRGWSFRQKLLAVLADESLPMDERSRACLAKLQKNLTVSQEKKLELQNIVRQKPRYVGAAEEVIASKAQKLEQKLLQKKAAKFIRAVDSRCLEVVKSATPEQAREVIEQVLWDNKTKMLYSLIPATISTMSLAASVLGEIYTGGMLSALSPLLSSAVGISWLIFDGKGLIEAFNNGQKGSYDNLLLVATSSICTTAIVAATVLSSGIPSLVVVGGVGLAWLATESACYIYACSQ